MVAQVPGGKVLLGETAPSRSIPTDALARRAGQAFGAVGAMLVLGTVLDWLVLWILQRQPSTQWEYVALQNSLEAIPRAAIGLALLAGGLHLSRVQAASAYRAVAGGFLLLAVGAAVLGGLLLLDYFVLAKAGQVASAYAILKAVTARSLLLSGLFSVVLGVTGMLGLRRLTA